MFFERERLGDIQSVSKSLKESGVYRGENMVTITPADDQELAQALEEMDTWPSAVRRVWQMEYLDLIDANPGADQDQVQLEAFRHVVATPAYQRRKKGGAQ